MAGDGEGRTSEWNGRRRSDPQYLATSSGPYRRYLFVVSIGPILHGDQRTRKSIDVEWSQMVACRGYQDESRVWPGGMYFGAVLRGS